MAIVVGVVLVAGLPAVAVAAVTSTVAAGVLTVTSDGDSDSIDIFCDGPGGNVKIQVNGNPPADPDSGPALCADITEIIVNGGDGEDSISLGGVDADFSGLTGPVVVNAGAGDDFVNGSPQDDDINGGDGNDFLQGGQGGTDTLDGEGGGDTSYLQIDPAVTQAVTANDTGAGPDDQDQAQVGGSGAGDTVSVTDTVFTAGLQTMSFTGMERRSVQGNEGDDTLDASANNSGVELDGGNGNDTLTGGSGEDFLSDSGGGTDTMDGGAGQDQLNVSGAGSKSLDGQADGDNYNVNFDPATNVTVDDSGAPPPPPPCPGCGSPDDDHLSGNGTSAGETITVTNLTMTLGAGTVSYPLGGGLEQLSADGQDGNDVLDASAVTDKRVSLVGKGGEDTLTGGALGDNLNGDDWPCFGDFGPCPIPAFPERDIVNGGAGNDQLMSSGGEDALGNLDALDGQEGDDNYQVALGPPELDLVDNPANIHSYGQVGAETWAAAEQIAVDWGGHLLTLNDAAEEAWVIGQFGTEPLAIGFNDMGTEGTFVWSSAEAVTYTNWCPNEPNDLPPGEDVAVMNAEVGGGSPECWNDVPDAGGGVAEFPGAILAPTAGADVNDTGAGGFDTLNAQGTSGNDDIDLTDTEVKLGAVTIVTFSGIEQPGASGLGGDDSIDASLVNPLNVSLNGNAGNDMLAGGAGNDSLNGDDFFFGCPFCPPPPPPGNDTMNGNGGNDTMNGNGGNDSYDGGDGSDNSQIQLGLAGASTVTDSGPPAPPCPPCGPGDGLNANGTPGDDAIFGDGASYWIVGLGSVTYDGFIEFADAHGQDGNDVMDGTASPPGTLVRFHGNGGNDQLIGGDGNDHLTGDDFFFGCPFCPPPPPPGDDTITGGAGDDYLFFRGGTDSGDGEEGNDRTEIRLPGGGNTTVTDTGLGTDDDHVSFQGEAANDTITITATTGSDGVGLTTFSGQETVDVFGNGGDDTINASAATVYTNLNGGNDNDTLIGSPNNDNLNGDGCCGDGAPFTPGNDVLNGGGGADNLWGDEGNDTLDGGFGGDWLEGGAGVDLVTYATRTAGVNVTIGGVCPPACGPSNDGQPGEGDNVQGSVENVTGGLGPDNLTGSASPNDLNGGGGNDVLDGNLGADILIGGAGTDTATYGPRMVGVNASLDNAANDGQPGELDNIGPAGDVENLTGGSGPDTLTGNGVINLLNGNSGADILNGGALGDTLKGGSGADILNGDDGADILDGQTGADVFNGGLGTDKADYGARTTSVTVTLGGGADDGVAGEGDNVGPTGDVEVVQGGTAADTITGDGNANQLFGGSGNDTLNGLAGFDTLTGQLGNDTLNGGADNDQLDGGLGADVFNGQAGNGDVAYYAGRAESFVISIDGVANDGSAGGAEGDNVGLDVEHITSGSGNDTLTGDADINTIVGGSGNDTINGGGGNDNLRGNLGADILNGGPGVADQAWYGDKAGLTNISIDGVANDGSAGEGDNVGLDVEDVMGGLGADTITGSASNNTLFGGNGNDILTGGGGIDTLFGGANDDDLFTSGDGAADSNTCGTGTDDVQMDAVGDTAAVDCENVVLV